MSRGTELTILVVAALGIAAFNTSGSPPDVEAQLFRFWPARVEGPPGMRVRWSNRDDVTHTVSAVTPEAAQSAFRLVLEGRGVTASAAFAERGIYPYFCERHQHMRGEISVQ